MVSLTDIRKSNKSLEDLPPGIVAVFAGATSGIGLGTLKALAENANAPRAYIIGRSKANVAHLIDDLKVVNPMGTFMFIEGQFSTIKDVDRMCEEIKKFETHVDFVCMSPGYSSLGGRRGKLPQSIDRDLPLTNRRNPRRHRNRSCTSVLFSPTSYYKPHSTPRTQHLTTCDFHPSTWL